MAFKVEWRQVKRFAEAAAMHRRTAEALLAGCGIETESELAYMAIYHLGYSVECLLKARFLSAIRPQEAQEGVGRAEEVGGARLQRDIESVQPLAEAGFSSSAYSSLAPKNAGKLERGYALRGRVDARRGCRDISRRSMGDRAMVRQLTVSRKRREKFQDELTRSLYALVKAKYPGVSDEMEKVVYRKPSGVVNLRIIDPAFEGTPKFDREDLLSDTFASLPPGTLDSIGLLLLLTPPESRQTYSYMMPAFDDPFGNGD